MLTREQAQEQLKAFQAAGAREQRLAAARQLKAAVQPIALALLEQTLEHDWTPEGRRRGEARLQVIAQIDDLGNGDRQQLFGALFPKIAAQIEAAWQLLHSLPYQQGLARRSFRAPGYPPATRTRRLHWLDQTLRHTLIYDQDIAWYAAWGAYLPFGLYGDLGLLLAAAMDRGDAAGQAVFDILTASARGEHPIGAMGRHVTRALLTASRLDGWDFVERLLLAAQRQEGLRQVVLEAVDESHPEAFRRMLHLIVAQNLVRFSAVVRAAAVWFGFSWDEVQPRRVHEVLAGALTLLEQPGARQAALAGADPQAAYLALWASAFEDAPAAIGPAARLLQSPDAGTRFAGVHALAQIALPPSFEALLPALDDEDLQVAGYAFMAVRQPRAQAPLPLLFDRLERILPRFPRKSKALKPLVWPWLTISVTQAEVAGALAGHLGDRPPSRLIPYLSVMDAHGRAACGRLLADVRPWTPELRQTFLKLVGDSSHGVREVALNAIREQQVGPEEVAHLEPLLARKAADLRRGLIHLLLTQPDPAALASAERLLAGAAAQRLAGLEMLERLKDDERLPDECQALARRYQTEHPKAPAAETVRLERLTAGQTRAPATLDDGLGLMDPSQRTRPAQPVVRAQPASGGYPHLPALVTPAAAALRLSLDALIHEHRETPIVIEGRNDSREVLLGQLGGLPPRMRPGPGADEAGHAERRVPLQEVWQGWWAGRPAELRDADGLELLRALAMPDARFTNPMVLRGLPPWVAATMALVSGPAQTLNYPSLALSILYWLLETTAQPEWAPDFVLDAMETTFALIPPEQLSEPLTAEQKQPYLRQAGDWRRWRGLLAWHYLALNHRSLCPAQWTSSHQARLWKLLRWLDQPVEVAPAGRLLLPRMRPDLTLAAQAYEAGAATEADLLDMLFEPGSSHWQSFQALRRLSGRKPDKLGQHYQFLGPLVARCRARIVEVELQRGDLPTAASGPAKALRWSGGLSTLVRLLAAGRGDSLLRGHLYGNLGREAVFSHLIRATFPDEADTPEAFAEAVRAARILDGRLIELALFAPHWARHVEHALGWPGLALGVWWLHAHTKDRRWFVDNELREAWAAEIGEHTPLSAADLLEGAVDVAWFSRAQAALSGERWEALYAAASLTSGGQGHSRARMFSDAMTGRLARADLVARVEGKRHQDALRALGLLPLAPAPEREDDLLDRYRVIQEFRRGIHKFGSQRQASEKLAARIGLENLARTAGYTDPLRLEWAMETRSGADLAAGAQVVRAGAVSVSLSIDDMGEPQVSVARGVKALKAIPADVKKVPAVAALLERKRDLDKQKSRVRASLEEAMCRGDTFGADEMHALFAHPVLAPMLSQLVFLVEGAPQVMGYPVAQGRLLDLRQAGTRHTIEAGARLRLAHPHDFLPASQWTAWQRECFVHERIQPFKQIFRELYVLTAAERDSSPRSRRYAGHQVNPRQAMALFTTRGWLAVPGEGIRRTFHAEGLSAWLELLNGGYTPAEMEGLTLEGVFFFRVGELAPLPLAEVPPRVFSEVMRDLDLVVSVAHVGGVDPEASASTVEMRGTLVRETCAMLGLDNVRLQGSHALVDGELGHYSVHLGSATVHRMPGGALCIIPVHSQQRGRLFLPFVDDDPKTAETVSKVLLLARDKEIKDPSILEQILT
jgi:hypothetical protein